MTKVFVKYGGREYNAAYLDIPLKWMRTWNKYMAMPMNKWPESLQGYCTEVSQRIGWSGDVAGCTVAKWIKREKEAGRKI